MPIIAEVNITEKPLVFAYALYHGTFNLKNLTCFFL